MYEEDDGMANKIRRVQQQRYDRILLLVHGIFACLKI